MSHKPRSRIRTLFAIPSAAVLMLSATQLLASPPAAPRAPNCPTFCSGNGGEAYCEANPTNTTCRYCGMCFGW
jgi:hypothetical protein